MKKITIVFLLALFAFNGMSAQQPADFHKMSHHLISLFCKHQADRRHLSPPSSDASVCVLMTLTDGDMTADLNALPAGLYAVQLTSNHQETTGSTIIRLK